MALLLGIDLGTSYFKVGLFDPDGALRGLGRVRVEALAPAPGRRELPVEMFWRLLRSGLAEALTQAGANAADIAGLSYSSQANSFVLLDRHDRPLTPIILWPDTRGGRVAAAGAAFSGTDTFNRIAGFRGITPEHAVVKLAWFARHQPALWARVHRVMTLSDYLTFTLTGEPVGDAGTAAFLGLYHLAERRWWPEALAAFGLEAARLSVPLEPGAACGRTVAAATTLLGVSAGSPFAVGTIDHHAAAVGSGLGRLADASISTGTVLAALVVVDRAAPVVGCYHGPHVDGARYFRLAFDPNGAGQLDDYQRMHAPAHSIEQLLALAARLPADTPGRTKAKPDRDDAAHGTAVRTILENTAATQRSLMRRVTGGQAVDRVVATGGGARSPLWLQINADMLGVPVVTPACAERACLGAAAFAAVAAGYHPNVAHATATMVHPDKVYEPNPSQVARYRQRFPETAVS
jgi:sugar (pentulose or hexulose) kinase